MNGQPLLRRAQNFRAIAPMPVAGGRRLREGVLYRTGDLSRLSNGCVDRLRELGIRAVVDLRSVAERRSRPYTWLALVSAQSWEDPSARSSASLEALMHQSEAPADVVRKAMTDLYVELPFSHAGSIGQIARCVIDGQAPLIFGCAAGKDRTGVAAALLLWQLGASREAIVEDYVATNASIAGLKVIAEQAFGWDTNTPHVEAVLQANPIYLDATFAAVEQRCGNIDTYFETILGIDAAGRKALADVLTEDVAA